MFSSPHSAVSAFVAGAIVASMTACAPQRPATTAAPEPASASFDIGVSMLELMVHVIQPAAEQFWAGAGYVSDAQGERALRPTTEDGWKSVEDGAMTTLETANLLMLPGRQRAPEADWARHVTQLRTLAKEAQRAAERQASDEELLDIGGRLYDACTACHEQFTNPQTQPAGTASKAPTAP